jgi:iron complex outermembrane receptor protein
VPAPATCNENFGTVSHAPTWLIDLDYKPSESVLAYAKYARGYRQGTVIPGAPIGFTSVAPEKVDNFEIGLKNTFNGAIHGTLDFAGFYNNLTNQQIRVAFQDVGNPATGRPGNEVSQTPGLLNAGESRIWGLEVEGSLNLFEGFRLDGGYTYLNTKLEKLTIPALPPSCFDTNFASGCGLFNQINPGVVAGGPLALSPKNKFSITAAYSLPLAPSIGHLTVSANLSYTSRQEVAETQYDYLPAYKLLNLNLNWDKIAGSTFDLQLFATNVLAEKYFTAVPGAYNALGFDDAQLGPPRMYGVRLRYSFGH